MVATARRRRLLNIKCSECGKVLEEFSWYWLITFPMVIMMWSGGVACQDCHDEPDYLE